MGARHISDKRQRRSKRYIAVHADLRESYILSKSGKTPSKRVRKLMRSKQFRETGE